MFKKKININQQRISIDHPNVTINIKLPININLPRGITVTIEMIFRRGIVDTTDISLQIEKAGTSQKVKEIRNKETTTHVHIIHDEKINCNFIINKLKFINIFKLA